MTVTMQDAVHDLLDVVDELTLPTRTKVVQWVERDGKEHESTAVVVHDPLLTQLEAAIASTIGAGSGKSMLNRHALNVLDSDALYQFTKIASTIGDWCRIVKVRPTRKPAKDLRAWYVARLALRSESDEFYVSQMRAWVRLITAKLNAPQSWEVKDDCPKCGASVWVEDFTDDNGVVSKVPRNRPILVTYLPGVADVFQSARAECRACGEEWRGGQALRSLRWDIDVVEAARAEAARIAAEADAEDAEHTEEENYTDVVPS